MERVLSSANALEGTITRKTTEANIIERRVESGIFLERF
jgi:hypothetical protein